MGKAAKNKVVKGQIHSIHANSEGDVGRVKKGIFIAYCVKALSPSKF